MNKRNKLKKILHVIERCLIKKLNYINSAFYTKVYTKYLKKIGVKIDPENPPAYIDPSAYLDGVNYSLISIGKGVTISREVMLLTHDYSVSIGLRTLEDFKGKVCETKPITVGNNSFIGARASLLPGTVVGENCIIGSGSVVKGVIEDNSIMVGNPAVKIADTREWAKKKRLTINL